MKISTYNKLFLNILIVLLVVLTACKDEEIAPSPQVQKINNFIWENLNEVYLWNDFIPQNIDRSREFDPEAYFEKLLFKPTDRFSFITDDYEALVNGLKGIEKSYGHNFKLFLLPNSSNLIGVIKYVIPNSPAAEAGIQRGDIFYKVNGSTLNSSNYRSLLFENESYTLSFGEIDQNGSIEQVEDIALTSVVIAENPIHLSKIIEHEGMKIGYLSFNQFIVDYNDSLVNVMQQFKSEGINDLVLDLRYNPGGSINTAILLGSMIAPASVVNEESVFSRLVWNEEITDYFIREEGEESDNLLSRFIVPEVNLDLDRVYVLITSSTASASELIINCLNPYMDVILVGENNTVGKYVGSITVHDEDESGSWAMQPIVMRSANSLGDTDYANGFAPQYRIEDDFNAPLGSLEEDMLARSVELITGTTIGDPARVAASQRLPGLTPVQDEVNIRKQILHIELN